MTFANTRQPHWRLLSPKNLNEFFRKSITLTIHLFSPYVDSSMQVIQDPSEHSIVQSYLGGYSIRQIATNIGGTPWGVRRILRKHTKIRSRGGINRVHKSKTLLTYTIILRIKIDRATHAELCKELRISRNTVKRYWNSAYGKAIREFVFCERLGQKKRDVIQRLRLERVPDSVIARTLDVSIAELRHSEF